MLAKRLYPICAAALLLIGGIAVAEDEPDRTWTNADLMRLFGPAPEIPEPSEKELARAEADAAAWEFVRDFLDSQRARNDDDRRYELDRRREQAEAELIDRTKTVPDDRYGYPFWPPFPYPRVPWPEPSPEPAADPPSNDDSVATSPSPRLDFTVDRMNDRRARIEEPFGGSERDAGADPR